MSNVQPQGVVWLLLNFFANFSLALLIKVLLLKKACMNTDQISENIFMCNKDELCTDLKMDLH